MNKEIAKRMAAIAYRALDDKKGYDIKVLDISEVSPVADYFIIADGSNPAQVEAMVDEVREKLLAEGHEPKRIEGARNSGWVLMDYVDIVVHVFSSQDRLFYDLERVWRDGKEVPQEQLED